MPDIKRLERLIVMEEVEESLTAKEKFTSHAEITL